MGILSGPDSTSGKAEDVKTTSNAAHTLEQGVIGGGRNQDSTTNNYDAVHEEANYTLFDPGNTNEAVISNAPAFFYGFEARTGTGTLTIRDDSAASGATVFKQYTLGTDDFRGPLAVRMENGITAQCGTGTDDCLIYWRAI